MLDFMKEIWERIKGAVWSFFSFFQSWWSSPDWSDYYASSDDILLPGQHVSRMREIEARRRSFEEAYTKPSLSLADKERLRVEFQPRLLEDQEEFDRSLAWFLQTESPSAWMDLWGLSAHCPDARVAYTFAEILTTQQPIEGSNYRALDYYQRAASRWSNEPFSFDTEASIKAQLTLALSYPNEYLKPFFLSLSASILGETPILPVLPVPKDDYWALNYFFLIAQRDKRVANLFMATESETRLCSVSTPPGFLKCFLLQKTLLSLQYSWGREQEALDLAEMCLKITHYYPRLYHYHSPFDTNPHYYISPPSHYLINQVSGWIDDIYFRLGEAYEAKAMAMLDFGMFAPFYNFSKSRLYYIRISPLSRYYQPESLWEIIHTRFYEGKPGMALFFLKILTKNHKTETATGLMKRLIEGRTDKYFVEYNHEKDEGLMDPDFSEPVLPDDVSLSIDVEDEKRSFMVKKTLQDAFYKRELSISLTPEKYLLFIEPTTNRILHRENKRPVEMRAYFSFLSATSQPFSVEEFAAKIEEVKRESPFRMRLKRIVVGAKEALTRKNQSSPIVIRRNKEIGYLTDLLEGSARFVKLYKGDAISTGSITLDEKHTPRLENRADSLLDDSTIDFDDDTKLLQECRHILESHKTLGFFERFLGGVQFIDPLALLVQEVDANPKFVHLCFNRMVLTSNLNALSNRKEYVNEEEIREGDQTVGQLRTEVGELELQAALDILKANESEREKEQEKEEKEQEKRERDAESEARYGTRVVGEDGQITFIRKQSAEADLYTFIDFGKQRVSPTGASPVPRPFIYFGKRGVSPAGASPAPLIPVGMSSAFWRVASISEQKSESKKKADAFPPTVRASGSTFLQSAPGSISPIPLPAMRKTSPAFLSPVPVLEQKAASKVQHLMSSIEESSLSLEP